MSEETTVTVADCSQAIQYENEEPANTIANEMNRRSNGWVPFFCTLHRCFHLRRANEFLAS